MALPKRSRASIYQYADFSRLWFWYAGGAGVDFTGCTAALSLRVSPSDPAPLVAVTTTPSSSGAIVLGTPTSPLGLGAVQLNIAKAATSVLTPTVAHGDLLITMSDGSVLLFVLLDATIYPGSTY